MTSWSPERLADRRALSELGASRELARRLVDEDLLAAGVGERVVLRFGVLIAS